MSDAQASPIKRALAAIEELRAELDALRRERAEPIAVIGMACRFPGGASSPEALWRLLDGGADAVTEVPPDRWPLAPAADPAPAQRAARWGAFLRDIDAFDPHHFGVSPREAASMDPQQRILLEVAWEALERAGQVPERLAGSAAGVFVGVMHDDHRERSAAGDPSRFDLHTGTGAFRGFAAGRISHVFGLMGPSLVVDTACSSSLVAVHLACQSLRLGECDLALAGGVSLMLSPATMEMGARLNGALSPEGRCRTFDARASGFVRGEGCGLVALKRLSRARADGDPVLALLRGSAVNQDGRSAGLTVPSVRAQEELLRAALQRSGVAPEDVTYVETHGTGTPLGDPIEVEALAAVLGGAHSGPPCALGALKPHLGHLEAAAGVAGLIKVVLAMEHGAIPANLHFEALNPRISLEGTRLRLATSRLPWPAAGRPRVAGVSSFGLSGTNAHIVVEEAPPPPAAEAAPAGRAVLLPLSARDPAALRALAAAYREPIAAAPSAALADLAYTAGARRAHFEHRLAVVGASGGEIDAALAAVVRGEAHPAALRSDGAGARPSARRPHRLVFVCPGTGAHRAGMGRELLRDEPAFRRELEACDAEVQRRAGWSLLEEIAADSDPARADLVTIGQPLIFALSAALAALWRSWGVLPNAVVGHSLGEVTAAYLAGALSLADAVRVVCTRAESLALSAGRGAMAAIDLGPADAEEQLRGEDDRLAIAAWNGPGEAVLSGPVEALDAALARLAARGVAARRLRSPHAFHGPAVRPAADALRAALADLAPRPVALPLYSTVTGARVEGPDLGPAHWARNVRDRVLFWPAVERLLEDGHGIFLELSAHPALLPSVDDAARRAERQALTLASLRRDRGERQAMLEALAALYAEGRPVDWARLHPGRARCVPAPTYPWQRQRFPIPGAPPARPPAVATEAAPPLSAAPEGVDLAAAPPVVHGVTWSPEPRPVMAPPAPTAPGRWILLGGARGAAGALAARLGAAGDTCARVSVEEPEQLRAAIDALLAAPAPPCRGVVHLGALDLRERAPDALTGAVLLRDAEAAAAGLLHAAQALAACRAPPRLWLVTTGAAVDAPRDAASLAAASLWGLGRGIAAEHPELAFTSIDLAAPGEPELDALAEVLRSGDRTEQVGLRGGARLVPRVAPLPLPSAAAPPVAGAWLVTGGLGALGLAVARWLARQGAEAIVLVGRRPPGEAAARVVDDLSRGGARILVERADVADAEQLAALLARAAGALPPLRGVVHAAGVAERALVTDLAPRALGALLAPKLAGAWNLHRLTLESPLDAFVLFSSVAAWIGVPGAAAYAAANASLDALARHRRALGLPALSIGWAAWSGRGMASDPRVARAHAYFERRGIAGIAEDDALSLLGRLLDPAAAAPPHVLTLPLDPAGLAAERRRADARWLALLGQEPAPSGGIAPARAMLAQATPAARRAALEQHVLGLAALVLGTPADQMPLGASWSDLGMDSFLATELRRLLEASLGVPLPVTLAWRHPTLADLTRHLAGALGLDLPASAELAAAPCPAGGAALGDMLGEIEQLPDAEVRRLLRGA
ncbi:type I polyketide synthase [Sorangium sp. So ce185]|uniref:type I polyketide synthase n=1 Tax=Sorangium sp. So ce185 TaxID=3133287 RepID=UPI003F637CED